MHFTFTDTSQATLDHWREFALEHLLDSDRLTRNLYDLRQIQDLPELAVNYAIEMNNDPPCKHPGGGGCWQREGAWALKQILADTLAAGRPFETIEARPRPG
jgi:hypothetical protein